VESREVYTGFAVAKEVFEGELEGDHAEYLAQSIYVLTVYDRLLSINVARGYKFPSYVRVLKVKPYTEDNSPKVTQTVTLQVQKTPFKLQGTPPESRL
jgi:hypothetical protein